MSGALSFLHPGVLTGDETEKLFRYAQEQGFAIPAFNCTSSSTVNAVLEGAKAVNSPVIIQFSNGGAAFFCGKAIKGDNQYSAVQGAIAGAKYVHAVAALYGIPVVLHTDHCAKKLLPWLDGCLDEDEDYFNKYGHALFSSHMIDLSIEKLDDNIEITKKYLERCNKVGVLLEMEIGVTGGEEDGVDNTAVSNNALYSQPEEIDHVYTELGKITSRFTVAAAFGNVHGVYAPGNVKLQPQILHNAQQYVAEKHSLSVKHPVMLVFHGGSGSLPEEITYAVKAGVVKMNIDTDTQWAYWEGLKNFYEEKKAYLQGQIGNPEGPEKPNKKYYDPRVWVRKSEETMRDRVKLAFERLGGCNRN
ncbi:hypothetical protein WA158_004649 [Blastocystis sp. Blastoise]